MILLLDNFDSFTYILVDYFQQLGVECKVFRNDIPLAEIALHNFNGIVLSPGPGTPSQAGNLMAVIDHYHLALPVLGICLGHQALGEYFGARLGKALVPMHGKVSEVLTSQDYLFRGLPERIQVTRYHSLILSDLPEALLPTAVTFENEVMALKHKRLPVRGLQFHPEAVMTNMGLSILKNWVLFNGIKE